jgi:argininosuccinate lyase|nr:argininosuccinate lyase [Desulfobulbaceae bacterium]
MSNETKMWGGRFTEGTAASVEAFSASIHYDSRLYRQDIVGSMAHAKMLAHQGLITSAERDQIFAGLAEIRAEIEAGTFVFRPELEDIHMNIEKTLAEKIGDAGARLHTGRSRNDQVNLDTRLYMRDVTAEIIDLLTGVQQSFVGLARRYLGAVMPGYTHLQRAQPVLISHHMLAYFEMFGRDKERLADGLKRINVLPLGAAAMAGTGLPIDREFVARELDFPAITANSMDTVGDRDFIVEFCATCAMIQVHLSRLSEELILWSTEEFKFVELADGFCTGSSIMPQKKNPDVPELIRGKSGRVIGNLMSVLTLLKGLPMTYNRDLQEDKEPLFDTIDTVSQSLSIMAELLANMKFYTETLATATSGGGYMTATDLADYLVLKNVPFRKAHSIVGQTVAYCIEQSKDLTDLSLEELHQFSEVIETDVFGILSVEGSVNSRNSLGGTGLMRVTEALVKAEKMLEALA